MDLETSTDSNDCVTRREFDLLFRAFAGMVIACYFVFVGFYLIVQPRKQNNVQSIYLNSDTQIQPTIAGNGVFYIRGINQDGEIFRIYMNDGWRMNSITEADRQYNMKKAEQDAIVAKVQALQSQQKKEAKER